MSKSIVDQLNLIFSPRSVAVIGASKSPYKWGAQTIRRLLLTGYKGAIYPINPTESKIQDLVAYPNVLVPRLISFTS